MRLELKELQSKTGVTVIFVTHDQIEAMVMSDRVVVMHEGVIQQIGPPTEIYHNPANRFVADFIGVANFFEVERSDGGCVIADDPRHVLPLRAPASITARRFNLMVRPEDIRMDRNQGDLRAMVNQKLFLGDAIIYVVNAEKTQIRVKTGSDEHFAPGDRVYLTLKQAHFFP